MGISFCMNFVWGLLQAPFAWFWQCWKIETTGISWKKAKTAYFEHIIFLLACCSETKHIFVRFALICFELSYFYMHVSSTAWYDTKPWIYRRLTWAPVAMAKISWVVQTAILRVTCPPLLVSVSNQIWHGSSKWCSKGIPHHYGCCPNPKPRWTWVYKATTGGHIPAPIPKPVLWAFGIFFGRIPGKPSTKTLTFWLFWFHIPKHSEIWKYKFAESSRLGDSYFGIFRDGESKKPKRQSFSWGLP